MTTLLIEEETADALKAAAEARGVTVDVFLRQVASDPPDLAPLIGGSSEESVLEFDRALDELFAGDTRRIPSTSLPHSRDDIYFDHD